MTELVHCYEELRKNGCDIPVFGWQNKEVSWEAVLDNDGNLITINSLAETIIKANKKTKNMPRTMVVPIGKKRTHTSPYFLCDDASYIFGLNKKDSEGDEGAVHFKASKELHQKLLKSAVDPVAKAIYLFFDKWNPENNKTNEQIINSEKIIMGKPIVFRVGDEYVHENNTLKAIWDNVYLSGGYVDSESDEEPDDELIIEVDEEQESDEELETDEEEVPNKKKKKKEEEEKPVIGRCMITGEIGELERIHPNISGVAGSQASGACFTSSNCESFNSYGKTQGLNAPISKYADFAFMTALNYLIKSKHNHIYIDDTTIVWFAKSSTTHQYGKFLLRALKGSTVVKKSDDKEPKQETEENTISDASLYEMMDSLSKGRPIDYESCTLNPTNEFFIIGISANQSRLQLRFFCQNTFGSFIKNIKDHYDRMKVDKIFENDKDAYSVYDIMMACVRDDKDFQKNMPQLLLNAILNNSRYPKNIRILVMNRVHAEIKKEGLTRLQAAIMKAFYLKNNIKNKGVSKNMTNEEKEIELENSEGYVLGRLFFLFEDIQNAYMNPNGKTDFVPKIRRDLFDMMMSTPGRALPKVHAAASKHLNRLEAGKRIYYEIEINKLINMLPRKVSTRLSLDEESAFIVGYYRQKYLKYKKKDKSADANKPETESESA